MTRLSRREIEKAIDELTASTSIGGSKDIETTVKANDETVEAIADAIERVPVIPPKDRLGEVEQVFGEPAKYLLEFRGDSVEISQAQFSQKQFDELTAELGARFSVDDSPEADTGDGAELPVENVRLSAQSAEMLAGSLRPVANAFAGDGTEPAELLWYFDVAGGRQLAFSPVRPRLDQGKRELIDDLVGSPDSAESSTAEGGR